MKNSKLTNIVICTAILSLVSSFAIAQSFRDSIIKRYGLNCLSEKNKNEVIGHIEYSARAYSAITAANFEIYTLTGRQGRGSDEVYWWTDQSGHRYETTHFLGAGAFTMIDGQSFLGNAGPLWLVLHKDGAEVKFTIE